MNNNLLLIIIAVLLMGSGIMAADNADAIQKFCANFVTEAVDLIEERK